ncbi:MAG: hypothetical protein MUF53_08175 [Gemmatimonadaceae bacterium]|nr:hypothetical protein [Gemmatimonadaceae bacterium]
MMLRRPSASALAALSLVLFAACDDGTGVSGTPTALRKVAGDSVSAPVAAALTTLPTVAVVGSNGSPIRNAVVTFSAGDTASGTVAGGTVRTDGDGRASPIGWNLGRRSGMQRLVARVQGLSDSVVFVARARASGAFSVEAAGPVSVTGTVLTTPATLPAVRIVDVFGNPVARDTVTFRVDTIGPPGFGFGTINNQRFARVVTDSTGVARAPWILGRSAGAQFLRARYGNTGNEVVFSATVLPGPAARIVPRSGQTLTVNPERTYAGFPQFVVSDLFGNPVEGSVVTFEAVDVGGTLAKQRDTSDAQGVVDPGSYTSGPATGAKIFRAALASNATINAAFEVTSIAVGASEFSITVRFQSAVSPEVRSAFDLAAARWAEIITGDLPNQTIGLAGITCSAGGQPFTLPSGTIVDDIVIDAAIVPIDGPGQVLGSAGWCARRTDAEGGLPLFGVMRFDEADMAGLIAGGRLGDVILHEMGHVLGIGTMWTTRGLLQNPVPSPCNDPTANPRFLGTEAINRYRARGGSDPAIAVENTNGCGTANGHWRENVFTRELMTGFLNSGVTNPISAMTIGSLQDVGYVVSYATAETCSPFATCLLGDAMAATTVPDKLIPLHEVPLDQPGRQVRKDARGRVEPMR